MFSSLYSPNTAIMRPIERIPHIYEVITPPMGDPLVITLDEAKAWLKIDLSDTSQDVLILQLIRMMQNAFEKYTRLTLFTTEFRTYRDYFGQDWELKRAPIQLINQIQYIEDNLLSVVDPLIYFLYKSGNNSYGYPVLKENEIWPNSFDRQKDVIHIDFLAGFGATPDFIPDDIKLAILYSVANAFENRGDCSDCSDSSGNIAFGLSGRAKAIADGYRIIDIGGRI